MNRRGFLGRLLAGVGTAALAPALDLFHVPSVEAAKASGIIVPTYQGAFSDLVRDALVILQSELPWPNYLLIQDGQIGRGPLTVQYGVDLRADSETDDLDREAFIERLLRPAVVSLARRASDVSAFGVLSIPQVVSHGAVATDTAHGVSLRGLRDYDVLRDFSMLRLDVVCG